MKQSNIIFSLVFLLAIGLTGFVPAESVTSIEGKEKWYSFSSSTGKFSIKFPAKPELSDTKKEEAITYKASTTKGSTTYFVGFTVHSLDLSGVDNLAQVSLDSFSEALNGEITEESEWKVKKNTGRQAVIKLKEQEARVDYKAIIVGQIQYQLVVIAPNGEYDEKAAKTFYKSFKLKK